MPYKNKEDEKRYKQRKDVKDRRNKARREKYANDPEYREKLLNILRQRALNGYTKNWRENNREKTRQYVKKYRENNKEKIKEHRKIYIKENREKINRNKRKWYQNNIEKLREQKKLWERNNPEKVREVHRKKCSKRRKTNPKYNLNKKMSLLIRQTLIEGKNGQHWETLVDYTLSDLTRRLKKTMPKGFIWDNFLQGKLHIDHKIPISAFNFNSIEHPDFKRCWALSNLQLLPAKENLSKGSKLYKPFQPALKLNFEVI